MENEDWITTLPDEVLVHIISYTDLQTRPNISLVSRKFYDCLCQHERDKFPLVLSGYKVRF